ncbi:Trafficking protein particle complex subunit 10 [Grifola frondosa]|uniref:Trafficking protein particle complex subunit 10 n=1 Tax=Grifola frondosa TaxID=5627 RepID=A0A1C7MH13_GRIFR|nr:Trafficking protein particle complex subunit 10 [Grifola frondosa]
MSTQKAVVTYSAPLIFLATDHWKQIHTALLSQFPLHNLHWKSPSRPSLRTIQELDISFVSYDTLREDPTTSQIPQSLLERPLLNLYVVICEDNETYKNITKKQIKDWHSSVSQRKNQEWLIVHILRPDERIAPGRLFQMKTSVLDKIRADFNLDKKDRCVQLVWSTDYENPTAWAEFTSKVKDGILSAFDSALTQREEEVKRSESQRQMPGWNFCTFFILKESLASSLEGMNLFEDALDQYYELESTFFQVLKEKNLSWFGPLISPTPSDDSVPLLSVTKKPYRDLILANTISIFDFRVYLLARQCALSGKLGDVVDITRTAGAFLNNFGRKLREVEDTLPRFFIESWQYSSALSVVEQCDTWVSSLELSKPTLASFNATKGELVEHARHQKLDIIGIVIGFLPSRPPFSIALPSQCSATKGDVQQSHSSQGISKSELLSALNDKDAFYDLYVSITNRAIELYASAGRRKFALKMHGTLAALDVHRGRLPNALQTYTSLPAHYAPHGWTSLESFMLTRALHVHSSAEKPRDRDWIHVLLHFLKAYVEDMGKELLIEEEDYESYISGLVSALKDAAHELDSDLLYPDHPAISVTVVNNDAQLAEDRDGATLEVTVHNRLPCDIPVDEVEIQLAGREANRLIFSGKEDLLKPGRNSVTLFCASSTAGTYTLHSSEIKISRLKLQWTHAKIAKHHRTKEVPTLVRIPKDLHALDVRLRQPQRIELGTPSRMMAVLSTGRNDIATATLKLSAPSGIQYKYPEATLNGDEHPPFRTAEDSITILDLKKGQTAVISIPHSDASAYHFVRVNITVEYVTTAEPDITRTLRLSRIVATSLPVAINVEDFFRGTRLFTLFTLSTTSHQHVRIRSTRLIMSEEDAPIVKVTSCMSRKPTSVTVTPAQPGRFLFQLDSARGQVRQPLQLQISYQVESLISLSVAEVLEEYPVLEPHRNALVDKLVQALERDANWVELYDVTGELVVPGANEDGELGEALSKVKQVLGKHRSDGSFGEWREILIPVDVPHMHILAAAHLGILANPFSKEFLSPSKKHLRLFAGQPISAQLTVTTSFHWAPVEDIKNRTYMMRYDVEDMTQDWLVSGRKRGDFVAKDGETFTVPMTLIALHHGELVLPKVAVTALPLPDVSHSVGASRFETERSSILCTASNQPSLTMSDTSEYEREREATIARNRAILAKLELSVAGLDLPVKKSTPKTRAKPVQPRAKRERKEPALPTRQSSRLRRVSIDPNETPAAKRKREREEEQQRKQEEAARLEAEERAREAKRPRHQDLDLRALVDEAEVDGLSSLRGSLQTVLHKVQPRRIADHDAFIFDENRKEERALTELKHKLKKMKVVARAKVTQDRIYSAAYHPEPTKDLIFFGDKHGQLGIWDARAPVEETADEDGDVVASQDGEGGRYWRLQMHWPATSKSSISTVKFDPIDSYSVFTSAYDCTIRSLSFTSGISQEIYSTSDEVLISSIDLPPSGHEMWISDASGGVTHLDLRQDKSKARFYQLSDTKIGSVSVNPTNPQFLVTASNDARSSKDIHNDFHGPGSSDLLPEFGIRGSWTRWEGSLYEHTQPLRNSFKLNTGKPRCAQNGVMASPLAQPIGIPEGNLSSAQATMTLLDYGTSAAPGYSKILLFHLLAHSVKSNTTVKRRGKWLTILKAQWSTNPDVYPHFTIGNMDHSLDIFSCKGDLIARLSDRNLISAVQAVTCSHPSIVERAVSGNASGRCVLWAPEDVVFSPYRDDMVKKPCAAVSSVPSKTILPVISFPDIIAKSELNCRVLLEDQILLVDDFFSANECKNFVKFIDGLPLELTPPKKRGEADRVNHRLSICSVDFAQRLFLILSPHLPSLPYPTSVRRPNGATTHTPHSLNSNIRLYKYTPEQHFGPHYDDSVRDAQTGAKSEWTLLVYLTGVEDGVEGGETIFYKDQKGKPRESITAPLTRGTALLHRHGNECLLHEGSPVVKGVKYILRSDLMFMN